ncbi:LysR family transcriptional regulator [Streptomyces sp. NPDC051976]|uniref:LysR family transcriptional regulator n=1 Tax=Streptomyces sp. NPDC051976 TaxID=3154947 RepID=UPI0034369B02
MPMLYGVSLRQLEYFLAIADEGSLSHAAAKLHIAQPSLSQQLRALERRAGGPLFERLSRGMRLTPAGRAFLPHARAAVRAAERAYAVSRAVAAGEAGEVEIATVSSIASGILPPVLRRWHGELADSAVRLHEFHHRSLLEQQVREGLGDLAVGPRPLAWDGPVLSLGHEEFVVVLPPGAGSAHHADGVSLLDLADRPWVMFGQEHGLDDLVRAACAKEGFQPVPAVRTWQVDAAARLAAAGVGPALLPDNALPAGLDADVRPARPRLFRELTCYLRGEPQGLAREFAALLRRTPLGLVESRPEGAEALGVEPGQVRSPGRGSG